MDERLNCAIVHTYEDSKSIEEKMMQLFHLKNQSNNMRIISILTFVLKPT